MTGSESSPRGSQFLSQAVEATIRIGLLVALVAWCFQILAPFIVPVVWAVIIAVAVHPAYVWLREALGERRRLAAALVTLLGLVVLIGPAVLLGDTLVGGTQALTAGLREGKLAIPSPPEGVRDWPLIGASLYEQWSNAAHDLEAALQPLQPQLVAAATWLLGAAAGAGFAFLQTVLAIVVAGVFLANDSGGGRAAEAIGRRLAGERGREFTQLAGATVRSVSQGILGVALIQASLAGIGFLAVGIPAAGLVALLGMLLCVIQIGLLPVSIPAVIWVFSTEATGVAVLFTIWIVVVSLIDNVLKPILLGRGVKVPMIVIFLGSLGGFLSSGIIGLFVGSVVLVLGYTLLRAWLEDDPPAADSA